MSLRVTTYRAAAEEDFRVKTDELLWKRKTYSQSLFEVSNAFREAVHFMICVIAGVGHS